MRALNFIRVNEGGKKNRCRGKTTDARVQRTSHSIGGEGGECVFVDDQRRETSMIEREQDSLISFFFFFFYIIYVFISEHKKNAFLISYTTFAFLTERTSTKQHLLYRYRYM